jgi:hypothetical protein
VQKAVHWLSGDCVTFKKEHYKIGGYSTEAKLLFDIRRLLKVVVALLVVFVAVFASAIIAGWVQVSHYELLQRNNMNNINDEVQHILANVKTVSGDSVPLTSNARMMMQGAASFMTAIANGNATYFNQTTSGRALIRAVVSPTTTARSLLAYDGQTDLERHQIVFENMVIDNVNSTLSEVHGKVATFNVSTLNDFFESVAHLFGWIVYGVNYTALGNLVERTMNDLEQAGNYYLLSTSALGAVAALVNRTAPTVGSLFSSFGSLQAADKPATPSASGTSL